MGFNLNIQNYDANGTYINTTVLARKNGVGYFEASPQITIVPPYKSIAVNWDQGADANLFAEDLIKNDSDATISTFLNFLKWKAIRTTTYYLWAYDSQGNSWYNIYNPPTPLNPIVGTYYVSIVSDTTVTGAVIETNYVSLKEPVYVVGSYLKPFYVNLKIEIELDMELNVIDANLPILKQQILYELKLNNKILASNKAFFDTGLTFDFDFSTKGENKVTGKIDISNIPINEEGNIDLKLHPAIYNSADVNHIRKVIYKNITLESSYEYQKDFKLRRTIDYTKELSVTIPYAATALSSTTQKFNIADAVVFNGVTINTPVSQTKIILNNLYSETGSTVNEWFNFSWVIYYILFNESYFNFLKQHPNQLYIKKAGTTTFTHLPFFNLYHNPTTNIFGITLYTEQIVPGDELWVNIAASTTTITDKHYLENTWKRSGQTESDTYINTLLKMYHSAVATPIKKIEGTAFGLFSPLDLIEFRYLTKTNYQFINLELNLTAGTSNVTIIEAVNQNVTDYE